MDIQLPRLRKFDMSIGCCENNSSKTNNLLQLKVTKNRLVRLINFENMLLNNPYIQDYISRNKDCKCLFRESLSRKLCVTDHVKVAYTGVNIPEYYERIENIKSGVVESESGESDVTSAPQDEVDLEDSNYNLNSGSGSQMSGGGNTIPVTPEKSIQTNMSCSPERVSPSKVKVSNDGVVFGGSGESDVTSAQPNEVVSRIMNNESGHEGNRVHSANFATPRTLVNADTLDRTREDLYWMGNIANTKSNSCDFILRVHCLHFLLKCNSQKQIFLKKEATLDHKANCLVKVVVAMIEEATLNVDYFGNMNMTETNSSFYLNLIETMGISLFIPMVDKKNVAKVFMYVANMQMETLDVEIVGKAIGVRLLYGFKIHGLAREPNKIDHIMHTTKTEEGLGGDFDWKPVDVDNSMVANWVDAYADDYEYTLRKALKLSVCTVFSFEDNEGNIARVRGVCDIIRLSEYNFMHLNCTARQEKFGKIHGVGTVNLITNIVNKFGSFERSELDTDYVSEGTSILYAVRRDCRGNNC